tara:strand:- start:142 stop:393 length:252 start_codon:yes stop_codon:yes gene_type:complete
MKNFKNKKNVNKLIKDLNSKDLENKVKELTQMLGEISSLDLTEKTDIFNKRTDILKDKAKNIEKDLKTKYKNFLPKEDLDSKK